MLLGNKRRTALLVLGCALLLRLSPMSVYNATLLLLSNTFGWAVQTVRSVPAATPPLKAAILNVTSDFDQLAHLICDFLEQPGTDPITAEHFKAYLAARAARSYPRLESLLDWLLAVYKFVFPFLLISIAAKRGSNGGGNQHGVEAAADEEPVLAALDPRLGAQPTPYAAGPLRRHSAQPNGGLHARERSGGYAASVFRPDGYHPQQRSGPVAAAQKSAGMVAPRAGSQSPQGPETPVESLLAHPAARQAAGMKSPRQPAHLETASEIEAEL